MAGGKRMKMQYIAPDVKLGENVKIHNFVNLYGCEVGDHSKIGCFVEVQKNARIGKYCKISSHTFICEGVAIEDNVFIGHSVVFINDPYPRATNSTGKLQTEEDWKVEPILVKNGASIGSNCTILSNVTIGENAIVGAGSVVTKDVPANTIVAGNPARLLRKLPPLTEPTAEHSSKEMEICLSQSSQRRREICLFIENRGDTDSQ
jgi:acetyltransferase-like isoleucine patch superfamily enzyme